MRAFVLVVLACLAASSLSLREDDFDKTMKNLEQLLQEADKSLQPAQLPANTANLNNMRLASQTPAQQTAAAPAPAQQAAPAPAPQQAAAPAPAQQPAAADSTPTAAQMGAQAAAAVPQAQTTAAPAQQATTAAPAAAQQQQTTGKPRTVTPQYSCHVITTSNQCTDNHCHCSPCAAHNTCSGKVIIDDGKTAQADIVAPYVASRGVVSAADLGKDGHKLVSPQYLVSPATVNGKLPDGLTNKNNDVARQDSVHPSNEIVVTPRGGCQPPHTSGCQQSQGLTQTNTVQPNTRLVIG